VKTKYIVGIAIIVAFIIFGALSFKKSLTPYVSFKEAKSTTTPVQIIGEVVFPEAKYDPDSLVLSFPLVDPKGERLKVFYKGTKPSNFEQAPSVVVRGKYENGVFVADQLLVKCPSKYQGEKK
jgi:cytochrome c-type biogenesis protein CcmE